MTERLLAEAAARGGPRAQAVAEVVLPLPAARGPAEGPRADESSLQGQLRLLNRVAQAAASNLNVDRLLADALEELDRHLPMTLCGVWLADEGPAPDGAEPPAEPAALEPALVLRAVGPGPPDRVRALGLGPGLRLPLSQTPFGPCWHHGEAVYSVWGPPGQMQTVWQLPPAERPSGLSSTPGVQPCLATALRAGERTVGVLLSVCHRPGGFTTEQVQTLYLVADLLGPAISNCRLHGRLRSTYEELRSTQRELIRTEKMRALGEMASGMAHDFNNSLCGVLGFLELALRDPALSTSTRQQLEMTRTCALDAAQTVRRVQDFARTRRNELTCHPVDVDSLVRETVELTRPRWEALARLRKGPIALELHTESASRVLGSAAELREILTNLIFNAVDAMPRGGTLTLSTRHAEGHVVLSVADTGLGMNAEVQRRLFEPFFTTKGERGCGLGLSVAFGLVRQHGGDIRVTSEVGRGSTFTVQLPVAPPAPERPAPAPRAEAVPPVVPGEAPPSPARPGPRVLVVEDEDTIAQLLGALLQTLGYRPRVVRGGREALDALASELPDLVLTDLGLPDLSGREVARAAAERAPGLPVVLLTGWGDQLQADGEQVPGVTRVVSKPVTIQKLAETLKALCPR